MSFHDWCECVMRVLLATRSISCAIILKLGNKVVLYSIVDYTYLNIVWCIRGQISGIACSYGLEISKDHKTFKIAFKQHFD